MIAADDLLRFVRLAAAVADDKKAEDIQVIDVEDRLKVADYFVLITGQNRTHVRALYNELHVQLKAMGETHRPVEGAELRVARRPALHLGAQTRTRCSRCNRSRIACRTSKRSRGRSI